MKSKSTLRAFLAMAGSSLLAITYASAGTYYWDSDGDATPGFGSAAGNWDAAGTGNLWSTSPTGDGVGGAAVPDYATTTADDLFFGTSFDGDVPPLYPFTGIITINGTVNANSIFCSSTTPGFAAGTSPVLNFPAVGSYEHATENTNALPALDLTGAATSMTWIGGFSDNLNIENIENFAGSNILQSGNLVIDGVINVGDTVSELGAPGTPFVFAGGWIRTQSDFPYTSLSAFNAVHPLTFTPNEDIGFDPRAAGPFTIDMPLNLGAGAFYVVGAGTSSIVMTLDENHTGGTYMVGGTLEISKQEHLGNITGPLNFGTGSAEGASGTLRIMGTTMTSLGARPMIAQDGRAVSFDIADVGNTFTVDQLLNQGTGGFTKAGAGSLIINTTSSYTGLTSVTGGTLSYGTALGLPTTTVTVNGATAALDLGAYNPSVTTVTLTNGSVTGSGTLTGTSYVLNGTSAASANMSVGVKLAGSGAMAKNNTGTATLSADNSAYSGTVTITSTGVLNINSTTALGTGTVIISGGNIDTTTGPLTLSTNNPITLGGGNFTFGGTNNLTFGSGAITNNNSRTITLNGSILTFGGEMTNTLANNQTTTVNGAGNTLVLGGYALSNSGVTRTGTITGTGNVTITGAVTNGVGGATLCPLIKSGTGTLTLQGTNTYTGATTVNTGGTLALVGGSQDSAITVNAGGSLGFTIGSATTSTKAVNLTNGTVTISNPGAVDNSSDYLLMTAAGAFTFTDPLTQLGTAIPNYELQLQNGNTELWLVYSAGGSAYQTWATGSEPFDGDANGDGVKDGLAFLLGAATPATDATGLLPTTSQTGGNLLMNFTCLATADRGTATLNLEYDGDLAGTWLSVPVPGAVGAPNPIVETTATGSVSFVATDGGTNGNGDALIDVEATISDATESASGKLFGRLKAEEN